MNKIVCGRLLGTRRVGDCQQTNGGKIRNGQKKVNFQSQFAQPALLKVLFFLSMAEILQSKFTALTE